MDTQDVPHTPDWRPSSSLSGGASSTAPSSTLQLPQSSPHADRESASSSSYTGIALDPGGEMAEVRRGSAPWAPISCATLSEQIRHFSAAHPEVPPTQVLPHLDSLSGALKEAAITIQYNARWFAEQPLADLLEVALQATGASSTSSDAYGGVTLVEVVGTYSLLPPQTLLVVAQFLSQTYYNATRANKTKKLADATWTTTEHILQSHLGRQYVVALLDVIGSEDVAVLGTKIGYARLAGAIMIITEKLLKKKPQTNLLEQQTTEFVSRLGNAATYGDEHIRNLIVETVLCLLSNTYAEELLNEDYSWSTLLSLVEKIVQYDPHVTKVGALVGGVCSFIDNIDNSEHSRMARLCIDVGRPLDPALKDALRTQWSNVHPARDWNSDVEALINKLAASNEYIVELEMLIARGIAVFANSPDRHPLAEYARHLQACINSPKTTIEATTVLGKVVVRIFMHCIIIGSAAIEIDTVFAVLCEISDKSLEAAEFIMRIRADVEGVTYVKQHQIAYHVPSVPLGSLHTAIRSILQTDCQWNIYISVLSQLPRLLGNQSQFGRERLDFIKQLKDDVVSQLERGEYREPPSETGLTKSHVACHVIETLTAILGFHRYLTKQEILNIISLILNTAGSRDYVVSIPCIHALTICCYELPDLMSRYMEDIIDKMSKLVTQRYIAIHVLLFLAGLSRLPDLFQNFRTQDYKKIFGVCGSYLQSIRGTTAIHDRQQTPSDDKSSSKVSAIDMADALPQYVYALAHHVLAFWYIALKPEHRRGLKEYIMSCLRSTGPSGEDKFEDQGLVTIDLMDRVDADETQAEEDKSGDASFDPTDGRITALHRLTGLLLVSTQTALRTGKSIVTVRRPSGTANRVLQMSPSNPGVFANSAAITIGSSEEDFINVSPDDSGGRTYGRIYIPPPTSPLGSEQILALPQENEAVERAIQFIDRTPGLDSHKAGVIYIGEDQKDEADILQNVQGSPDYVEFVENLGTLRRLKNAPFNTQGLDRSDDADGEHAIVWNNEVTELVYHVTTLMPNNPDVSLNTANKKRHIGNDFVNIIFNNSGVPFDFKTFPSSFNAVYIVISPSARTTFLQTRLHRQSRETTFYRVQVLTRPGYPAISSAATEKIVSAASLAPYVRNLALNDCVFSVMWNSQEGEGGEYPSSWRSRLEQIRRLRERFGS